MKRAAFVLWQCSWGCVQTLLGFVVFLACRNAEHMWYHGALVTSWNKPKAVSLGLFIFVGKEEALRVHEYGHSVQSLFLGPFYLPLILLPSLTWAGLPLLCRWRRASQVPYAWLYTESWANRWGEWVTGEKSIGKRLE